MDNKFFQSALSNFSFDMASGGAIRHLADRGFTASQIATMLDYPTPMEKIRKEMTTHFYDKGILSRDRSNHQENYLECPFGKWRYQNELEYEKKLKALDQREREYLDSINWPLTVVYHIADKRMMSIMKKLHMD